MRSLLQALVRSHEPVYNLPEGNEERKIIEPARYKLGTIVAAVGGPNHHSSLAIDYYVTLAVFAISLDNCDHLWEFRFSFFDRGCVPVRIVTSI
jgi:hypothetical protein